MAIFFLSKDSRICCSSFWGRSTGWAWAGPSAVPFFLLHPPGTFTHPPGPVPAAHLGLLHEGLLAPAQLPPQHLQRCPVLQGPGASLLTGLRKSPGSASRLWAASVVMDYLGSGVEGAVRGIAGSVLTVAEVLLDSCRRHVLTQVRAVQLECSGHSGRNCCPGPRRAPSCSRRSWFCLFWGWEAERWMGLLITAISWAGDGGSRAGAGVSGLGAEEVQQQL